MDTFQPGELLYRITENGTIKFRPNRSGNVGMRWDFSLSSWLIVIELDNRFQPPGFIIEFIDNPWAYTLDVE